MNCLKLPTLQQGVNASEFFLAHNEFTMAFPKSQLFFNNWHVPNCEYIGLMLLSMF